MCVFHATSFSCKRNSEIRTPCMQLGVDYVDLYLIHSPRYAQPDIPTAWAVMEKLKAQGLTKSIGVSNFEIPHLTILVNSAKVYPAANQARPARSGIA